MHVPFYPDNVVVAGFSGSFAPYLLPALAGRHDNDAVISLTRRAVNNQNPAIQSGRVVLREQSVVSQNLGFRESRRETKNPPFWAKGFQ
jgi:hypothetical protein